MEKDKFQQLTISVFLILFGCICYYLASEFLVTKAPGRLGPDFWPKMLALLIIIFSVGDVVIILLSKKKQALEDPMNSPEDTVVEFDIYSQKYPLLLLGGFVSTVVYIYLLPILGFSLCTVLYLAGIMYLGRYRNIMVIIISSFVGAFTIFIVFSKIVYISLPTGVGVLGDFTFFMYRLLGVS